VQQAREGVFISLFQKNRVTFLQSRVLITDHFFKTKPLTMKRIFLIMAVAGSLLACTNSADSTSDAKDSLDSLTNEKKEDIDSTADERKEALDSLNQQKKDAMDAKDTSGKK
jgi:hypothetical protein